MLPAPGKQVQEFVFEFGPELHKEMKHLAALEERCLWKLLSLLRRAGIVKLQFGLAICQNIMLVLRYSSLQIDVESVEYTFGVTQLVTSCTVFAAHATENSFRGWRELAQDTELLFLTAAFVASCFGLVFSPLFFCFHLLDIVNKSNDLQAVFQAVTLNGRSIVLTAVFGFIVVWIYAIIGFAFMPGAFVDDDNVEMCPDVFVCWITALMALAPGDMAEVMERPASTDPTYPLVVAYTFTYYIVVVLVLLNVIFGRPARLELAISCSRALTAC